MHRGCHYLISGINRFLRGWAREIYFANLFHLIEEEEENEGIAFLFCPLLLLPFVFSLGKESRRFKVNYLECFVDNTWKLLRRYFLRTREIPCNAATLLKFWTQLSSQLDSVILFKFTIRMCTGGERKFKFLKFTRRWINKAAVVKNRIICHWNRFLLLSAARKLFITRLISHACIYV